MFVTSHAKIKTIKPRNLCAKKISLTTSLYKHSLYIPPYVNFIKDYFEWKYKNFEAAAII